MPIVQEPKFQCERCGRIQAVDAPRYKVKISQVKSNEGPDDFDCEIPEKEQEVCRYCAASNKKVTETRIEKPLRQNKEPEDSAKDEDQT